MVIQMRLSFSSFFKELFLDDSEYKNLASWLLGSYYVQVTKDAGENSQIHITSDEGKRILKTSRRLGPAMDKSLTSVSKDPGSIKSIVGKPLGHCHSIIFWSDPQKQITMPLGGYQR